MNKSIFAEFDTPLRDKISSFILKAFAPENEELRQARTRATGAGLPEIQIGAMDVLHLQVLARLAQAKKAVEIGTLGGYSGLALLRGMGTGSKLWTFEISHEHARVARDCFLSAGFRESQAQVVQGEAIKMLPTIESQGPFDLVFIDADKTGYNAYLEWAHRNLRIGGVIIADNTLAWGMVADDAFDNDQDRRDATALREFNERVAGDKGRFLSTLIPTSEGLTVAVKIG